MSHYIVTVVFMSFLVISTPLRIIIDCQPENNAGTRVADKNNGILSSFREFCRATLQTIARPQDDAIQDQLEAGDDEIIISTLPPRRFLIRKIKVDNNGLPRLQIPRVKVPKIKVPKLKKSLHSPEFLPTTVVNTKPYAKFKDRTLKDDAFSTERTENFKKGIQKMLHVVKVLGEIDQYLSDRTRIVIHKILKVFSK